MYSDKELESYEVVETICGIPIKVIPKYNKDREFNCKHCGAPNQIDYCKYCGCVKDVEK